jgi:hypothetical protein
VDGFLKSGDGFGGGGLSGNAGVPPFYSDLLQWQTSVLPATGEVGDRIGELSKAKLVGSNCLTLDGTSWAYIQNSENLMNFGSGDIDIELYLQRSLFATRFAIGKYDYPNNKRQWAIEGGTNVIRFLSSRTGTDINYLDILKSAIPTEVFSYRLRRISGIVSVLVNGVPVAFTGSIAATIFDSNSPVLIGCVGNLTTRTGFYTGRFFGLKDHLTGLTIGAGEGWGTTLHNTDGSGNNAILNGATLETAWAENTRRSTRKLLSADSRSTNTRRIPIYYSRTLSGQRRSKPKPYTSRRIHQDQRQSTLRSWPHPQQCRVQNQRRPTSELSQVSR